MTGTKRLQFRFRGVLLFLLVCMTGVAARAQTEDMSPEALYQNGLKRFNAGDYAGASRHFRQILDVFGAEPELKSAMERVYYALGCCLYNQEDFLQARSVFKEYTREYPEAEFMDEALFRIATSLQVEEAYNDAVSAYRELISLAPHSPFAEDAAFQIAMCRLTEGDFNAVIQSLAAFLDQYPKTELRGEALMYLSRAYYETQQYDEALATLERLTKEEDSMDHLVYVSFLAVEIGDAAFDETDYDIALKAYRRVRTKTSLLRLQQKLITRLEERLAALDSPTRDLKSLSRRFREERRVEGMLARAEATRRQLEGMPDYDGGLFHRIGRCFFNSDRYWESNVAFGRAQNDAKSATVQEAAHFDVILVYSRLRRFNELVEAADAYLAKYGRDEALIGNGRVPAVAMMRAESFLNRELFEEAEEEMQKLLEAYPDHVARPRIEFYLALSIAMQERFKESITLFDHWLDGNKEHAMLPEVLYWRAVALFYDSQYEKALAALEQYAKDYPLTVYTPEAEYRAAMCMYALEDFENCALALGDWLDKHPGHYFQWEAQVTRGDAFAAIGKLDEAIDCYRQITSEAGPIQFLALTQLAKVYKALDSEDSYQDMAAAFSRYILDNPDSDRIVEAAYHAGWALRQMGETEKARKLYWNMIRTNGNKREWQGFDALMQDLVQLYKNLPGDAMRKDVQKELAAALVQDQKTLASRLELLRIMREKPEDRPAEAEQFAKIFPANVLGAEGLAFVGEHWANEGRREDAAPYMNELIAIFPDSPFASKAHLQKAESFLRDDFYDKAQEAANLAIATSADTATLMEATYIRARTMDAMGRIDEAVEDYNLLLASRATPRELKPRALLHLAFCQEKKGDYRKAIPYYQRIYVLYGAYTDEVAAAYLRSGIAFEKLRDWEAAANTYREMLSLESMKSMPEAEQAGKRLARLES